MTPPNSSYQPSLRLEAYTDAEVQAAVEELFSDKSFLAGMAGFLPAELYAQLLQSYNRVKSSADFQAMLMVPFLEYVRQLSVKDLAVTGLDDLDPAKKYLFISNHRDIGLDSAFLNWTLRQRGFTTSQIAIGDNLMKHRLAELIFRINKSFAVCRSGTARELYAHSVKMSTYIHDLIMDGEDSVWIAQREGRAKDGNDRTQVALLKMLSLGAGKQLFPWLEELQIVPVAISYEYDPTDLAKTKEYLAKRANPNYKKTFAQDMSHIFMGIRGQKGNVHLHFDGKFTEEVIALQELGDSKAQLLGLASAIDRSIHQHYCLRAINYVALDLLTGAPAYASHYKEEEYQQLAQYFERKISKLPADQQSVGRDYLLRIYANPVFNATTA